MSLNIFSIRSNLIARVILSMRGSRSNALEVGTAFAPSMT
jgi:hypothetical protein